MCVGGGGGGDGRKKVASLVQFNLIFISKLFPGRFVLRALSCLLPGVLAVGFGVSDLLGPLV